MNELKLYKFTYIWLKETSKKEVSALIGVICLCELYGMNQHDTN